MKVQELMINKYVSASPETKFRELWKMIFKKHFHAIPVLDDKRKLIGIVSEEDLLARLYPSYQDFLGEFTNLNEFEEMEDKIAELGNLKAKDIMNKDIASTYKEAPVLRALSQMILREIRQLPVLDEEKRLLGMISKGDIFDALFTRHVRIFRRIKRVTMK